MRISVTRLFNQLYTRNERYVRNVPLFYFLVITGNLMSSLVFMRLPFLYLSLSLSLYFSLSLFIFLSLSLFLSLSPSLSLILLSLLLSMTIFLYLVCDRRSYLNESSWHLKGIPRLDAAAVSTVMTAMDQAGGSFYISSHIISLSCRIMTYHIELLHIMSYRCTRCCIMSCHVMSCHVMSCHLGSITTVFVFSFLWFILFSNIAILLRNFNSFYYYIYLVFFFLLLLLPPLLSNFDTTNQIKVDIWNLFYSSTPLLIFRSILFLQFSCTMSIMYYRGRWTHGRSLSSTHSSSYLASV